MVVVVVEVGQTEYLLFGSHTARDHNSNIKLVGGVIGRVSVCCEALPRLRSSLFRYERSLCSGRRCWLVPVWSGAGKQAKLSPGKG